MQRVMSILVILMASLFANGTYALTIEQLQEVKTTVVEICRGGTITGDHQAFSIKGAADGKVVVIKKLAELGINGEIQFSRNEWEGIVALVPKDGDPKEYTHCVDNVFPIIIRELNSNGNAGVGKWRKIYSFVMPGPGPSSPGNPIYLVVPRHYDKYHADKGMIALEIPPRGTTLSVSKVTSNSVSFLIEGPSIGKIDSSLLQNEADEWQRGKYLYSLNCVEIDNGPKGDLSWARFAVSVYEKIEGN